MCSRRSPIGRRCQRRHHRRAVAAAPLPAEGSRRGGFATSRMRDFRSRKCSTTRRARHRVEHTGPVQGAASGRRGSPGARRGRSCRGCHRMVAAPTPGRGRGSPPRDQRATDDGPDLVGHLARRQDARLRRHVRRTVALVAAAVGRRSARPLAGTENARFPFWSPDSRSVGFAADAPAQTRRPRERVGAGIGVRGSVGRGVEPGRHDPLRSRDRWCPVQSL